jgi:hypothetical protein
LDPRTPEEQERAKYFDRFGSEVLRPGTETTLIFGEAPVKPPPLPGDKRTAVERYEAEMRDKACRGVFLVARPIATRVVLNSKRTFLFTDVALEVDRWIHPTSGPATAVLSRPGGTVIVGQAVLTVTAAAPLKLNGQHVMHLLEIPKAGSYRTIGSSIEVIKGKVLLGRDWPGPPGSPEAVSLDRVIADLQSAAARCK